MNGFSAALPPSAGAPAACPGGTAAGLAIARRAIAS